MVNPVYTSNKTSELKFIKISKSQVALHPQPKGVIQFIGAFVFGSFPLQYYYSLLENLYQKGYTLFIYRFPLNPLQFDHLSVAVSLLEEQYSLRVQLLNNANSYGISEEFYADHKNYSWVGHSLGGKYVVLLEILSNYNTPQRNQILRQCLNQGFDQAIADIQRGDNARIQANQELNGTDTVFDEDFFIRDQKSVLLAPKFNNAVDALNSSFSLVNPLSERLVFPNQKATQCLINNTRGFFNLMGLIRFKNDCLAIDDPEFIVNKIQELIASGIPINPEVLQDMEGSHLQPTNISTETLADSIDEILRMLPSP
ncbi:DUF1350 family protein [Crocosphaera chwakensis]|uniref:DUF1350 domain-containing protein n=1 Tax=Crocosphaera chwakensis CCY0110 TaxID=391612 RepID=A3IGW9_9CHRO|nr:DUF1350 family protein [Crocosphaera chwakensis]EAZ94211.1 hypothetical protein CY0110_10062 [Crocosphaera chwakensis CCY0110]